MEKQETLEKINISEQAARLTEPFTMIDLAQIDDLALSIFLCQGTLPSHRHLDQDELFLVHSGTISLESDWGPATLRPGELAVVPKGLGHRSSSLLRSLVLLLQPRLIVNRRNGDRRLFALEDEGRLEKVSVPAMGRQVAIPFSPVTLAHLDTFALNLVLCQGTGPWWQAERQSSLVLCYDGNLDLDSELGQVSLQDGDMVVLPKGIPYQLSSSRRALMLGVERHKQPGLPLPD
ncbi:MAG TPA: cupin domain-containing protein [Anaerolineae bacterium]|nr:cupin domain-containing protein [Anaerolineae bacterium]